MPRGRLPSGMVVMTCAVPVSITVISPDTSLVTKSRGAVDSETGADSGTAAFLEEQAASDIESATATMSLSLGIGCLITGYSPLRVKLNDALPDGAIVTFCSCVPRVSCHTPMT